MKKLEIRHNFYQIMKLLIYLLQPLDVKKSLNYLVFYVVKLQHLRNFNNKGISLVLNKLVKC